MQAARTKTVRPNLARHVAQARAVKKESLQVFATGAGLSIPRLRDAECHGLATDETVWRIAEYLGVKPHDICSEAPPLFAVTQRRG